VELERGFQIDHPAVFLPWGVTEQELAELLPRPARRVTDGYHTFDCTALTGLLVVLGLHFEPRRGGVLHELELHRPEPADLAVAFGRSQHHLELTFGPPHDTRQRPGWYPSHEWRFGDVRVRHYAQHRFVHEDRVRIERV
jgi:hypothetical protein